MPRDCSCLVLCHGVVCRLSWLLSLLLPQQTELVVRIPEPLAISSALERALLQAGVGQAVLSTNTFISPKGQPAQPHGSHYQNSAMCPKMIHFHTNKALMNTLRALTLMNHIKCYVFWKGKYNPGDYELL